MGRFDKAPFRYTQRVIYASKMDRNDQYKNNVDEWIEQGTPDWSNTNYVELDDEAIYSNRQYQYGVLTFNAWCDNWTNCKIGFGGGGTSDYMEFTQDCFNTNKHGSGEESTPCAIADSRPQ